jgi:hypothetical protein
VDQVTAILRRVRAGDVGATPTQRLCVLCVEAAGVTGAGLSVTTGQGQRSTIFATDPVSDRIEDLQVSLGEGPCVDAVGSGGPVLIADLREPAVAVRWPGFAEAAMTAGAQAAFALPLQVGAIQVGALDLYRDRPGELCGRELSAALAYAEAVTRLILDLESGALAGEMPTELTRRWGGESAVHQATGMIMVQIGGDIATAFARLRAHAYLVDRGVEDVARDIVARRLRFDRSEGDGVG